MSQEHDLYVLEKAKFSMTNTRHQTMRMADDCYDTCLECYKTCFLQSLKVSQHFSHFSIPLAAIRASSLVKLWPVASSPINISLLLKIKELAHSFDSHSIFSIFRSSTEQHILRGETTTTTTMMELQ